MRIAEESVGSLAHLTVAFNALILAGLDKVCLRVEEFSAEHAGLYGGCLYTEAREFGVEAVAEEAGSGLARAVEVAGWYWEPRSHAPTLPITPLRQEHMCRRRARVMEMGPKAFDWNWHWISSSLCFSMPVSPVVISGTHSDLSKYSFHKPRCFPSRSCNCS